MTRNTITLQENATLADGTPTTAWIVRTAFGAHVATITAIHGGDFQVQAYSVVYRRRGAPVNRFDVPGSGAQLSEVVDQTTSRPSSRRARTVQVQNRPSTSTPDRSRTTAERT